ncbi:MAG: hypothetical protein V8R80_10150 [Eubacterium sp.]
MKTIYAEAQPGKVVLKEKELPAPGSGIIKRKIQCNESGYRKRTAG